MADKKNILVYAHWLGLNEPKAIGMLTVQMARGKTAFSFTYDDAWLNQKEQFLCGIENRQLTDIDFLLGVNDESRTQQKPLN